MFAPEHFQRFPRRAHVTFSHVLLALADSLGGIDTRSRFEQMRMGLGILYDCLRLSPH